MTHEVGDRVSRDRIITLTDGVLAIVMTLLVLEIVVPELSRSEVATELPKRLLELLPDVWSYATSFIILGFFWIAHDDQFHYIKRANRTLLWLTIFYLMFIAFIPFSTGSDWSIWRSADFSNHIWNQHYDSSILDIFAMEVRYQRTSFSR